MRRWVFVAICFCINLFASGCATNPDPGQGGFIDGLVGMSSGGYQGRVDQRQQNLSTVQSANAKMEEQNRTLKGDLAATKEEEQAYRDQLARLQGDMKALQSQLAKAKVKTQADLAHKKELEQNLASLNGKIAQANNSKGSVREADLQEELNKLKAEKEKLKQQILKLGSK